MIIGLTGQTGSGKSTLCDYLKKRGFYICSCDDIAKEVRNDARIALRLADVFGFDIIDENNSVDRKLLAERAFKNKETIRKLNGIMHPEILSIAFDRIDRALRNGYEYAVLDAPQLFESQADRKCDFIVSVIADREKRIKRILSRDGITEKEVLDRLSVQYDDPFYIDRSDHVIVNDGNTCNFEEKADELVRILENITLHEALAGGSE